MHINLPIKIWRMILPFLCLGLFNRSQGSARLNIIVSSYQRPSRSRTWGSGSWPHNLFLAFNINPKVYPLTQPPDLFIYGGNIKKWLGSWWSMVRICYQGPIKSICTNSRKNASVIKEVNRTSRPGFKWPAVDQRLLQIWAKTIVNLISRFHQKMPLIENLNMVRINHSSERHNSWPQACLWMEPRLTA